MSMHVAEESFSAASAAKLDQVSSNNESVIPNLKADPNSSRAFLDSSRAANRKDEFENTKMNEPERDVSPKGLRRMVSKV